MSNILLYVRSLYLLLLAVLAQAFDAGASQGVVSFLIPSILMGIGVAIDVFIATIVQFKDNSLTWRSWTLPVTLTHITFPAIGYFLFWNLATLLPFAQSLLGVIGFTLVALFVYEVLAEATGTVPRFGISRTIGSIFHYNQNEARLFITILAVSWDALWSGPAKAAQAVANNWNEYQVVLSFIIAGLVVALLAEVALFFAHRLRRRRFANPYTLAQSTIIGMYVELSVIGGFGVLSLWHAFSDTATLYQSISLAAILLIVIFTLIRQPLKKQQLIEAKSAVH